MFFYIFSSNHINHSVIIQRINHDFLFASQCKTKHFMSIFLKHRSFLDLLIIDVISNYPIQLTHNMTLDRIKKIDCIIEVTVNESYTVYCLTTNKYIPPTTIEAFKKKFKRVVKRKIVIALK